MQRCILMTNRRKPWQKPTTIHATMYSNDKSRRSLAGAFLIVRSTPPRRFLEAQMPIPKREGKLASRTITFASLGRRACNWRSCLEPYDTPCFHVTHVCVQGYMNIYVVRRSMYTYKIVGSASEVCMYIDKTGVRRAIIGSRSKEDGT